jgi:hypothetical protein
MALYAFVFINGLFKDTVSSSDNMASNDNMINELECT